MTVTSVLVTGVGGQGAVLLTNIMGNACAARGMPVKTGELHGLSQRSGSIFVHCRMGEGVRSPVTPLGGADVVASLELNEALRYLEYLHPDGTVVVSTRVVHHPLETIQMSRKEKVYTTEEELISGIRGFTSNLILFDGKQLALDSGNHLTENVVLLGALFGTGKLPLTKEDMLGAIERLVPQKALEANVSAFDLGLKAVVGE